MPEFDINDPRFVPEDHETEDDPEQAALMSLAEEAEATRDLGILSEEIEDKGFLAEFLDALSDSFQFLKAGFLAIFSIETLDEPEASEEVSAGPMSVDLRIIDTNPYILTAEDLVGFNDLEVQSLSIIAQAGISPRNIMQLYEDEASSSVNRETFLKYAATTVEACAHYGVKPDLMFPLILATMKSESEFSDRSYNARSGATGLMQHMPQYWDARAERLVDAGVYASPPDIWDTRAQIFAAVDLYLTNMTSFTNNPNTYPPHKFARDVYLTYNCGRGHAWLVREGVLDWEPVDVYNLYNMSEADRVAQFGSDADTFRPYALRRLTLPRADRTFDKVQARYDQYRNTLWT